MKLREALKQIERLEKKGCKCELTREGLAQALTLPCAFSISDVLTTDWKIIVCKGIVLK